MSFSRKFSEKLLSYFTTSLSDAVMQKHKSPPAVRRYWREQKAKKKASDQQFQDNKSSEIQVTTPNVTSSKGKTKPSNSAA